MLPMTRVEIADYLGLTLETVSRTLASLKRDGLIDIPDRHGIVIRRPADVCHLAECVCAGGRNLVACEARPVSDRPAPGCLP